MAQWIAAVASDRGLDAPGTRTRMPAYERQVFAFERPPLHERLQLPVRLVGARDDHQPRRVAVEAMHDPAARLPAAGSDSDESVHERAACMPGGGMHNESRRLVDDEQVFVLERDAQVELLGLDRLRSRGLLEFDLLPAL